MSNAEASKTATSATPEGDIQAAIIRGDSCHILSEDRNSVEYAENLRFALLKDGKTVAEKPVETSGLIVMEHEGTHASFHVDPEFTEPQNGVAGKRRMFEGPPSVDQAKQYAEQKVGSLAAEKLQPFKDGGGAILPMKPRRAGDNTEKRTTPKAADHYDYTPEEYRKMERKYVDEVAKLKKDCDRHQEENLPTRSNILRHLDWLVQGVAPGQTVLFVFSGYGTQKRFQCSPPAQPQPGGAPSGTNRLKGRSPEMQGYLVPQDFIDKNDLSKLISSRDLMSKLAKLPAGSRAVTVLDCCHGGLLPAVGGEDCSFSAVSHRPAPPSRAAVCRASRSSVFPRYLDVNEGKRAGGPVSTDQQPPPALPKIKCSICSISCTNSSTNCEAFIEGTWQGMLSWSLVKCLSRQKGIPSSEVLESHLSEDFVKMRKVFFVEAIPEVRASPGEECEDAGSPAATEATVPVAA
eukprot:Polyplicarium_translucidae@DN3077_c0_g1_i7.p1